MGLNKKLILIVPSSIFFFLVVPIFSIFSGRVLDKILKLKGLNFGLPGIALSILVLFVGGYYIVESIRILLVKGQGIPLGDVIPEEQSTELITTGIYSHTRNPMLFGYLLYLVALGSLVKSCSAALINPITFLIPWIIWLKTKEEPALERRFGETYLKYKEKTPFLIPKPWKKLR